MRRRDTLGIEGLSDTILRLAGAAGLVQYRPSEIMTTHDKRVDVPKSICDLGHRDSYGLEEGLRLTADWMRQVYSVPARAAGVEGGVMVPLR